MFWEVIALYSERHKNVLSWRNVEYSNARRPISGVY